jgi:hypothetical protein
LMVFWLIRVRFITAYKERVIGRHTTTIQSFVEKRIPSAT